MRKIILPTLVLAAVLGIGGFAGAAIPPVDKAFAASGDTQPTQALAAVDTQATSKAKVKAGTAMDVFRVGSANFSLKLFQKSVAAKGKNANVTIAPMSVMNALAITANGADGKTRYQMRKVLMGGATMPWINQQFNTYMNKLVNAKKARIQNANSIWYHNDGTLIMKKSFLNTSKKFYNAEVNAADFGDPATVGNINNWVADNTNNMIKRVISQLDESNRIAIVNALYFDAEWRNPYTKNDVYTRTFTNAKGQKRKVKMMLGTESTYIEGENVTGFMKPYAKGYSYVALLPKEGMSLKKFVSTLDGDTFRSLIAKRKKNTPVHTGLPKYTLTYTNDSMEKQLQRMGLKLPFSMNADFSKMGTDKTGDLYIDQVIHKTKIILDEKGTKAAAVTAAMMKANAAIGIEYKTVILNRPFVYAIIDNANKLPIFIGTVNNIGTK